MIIPHFILILLRDRVVYGSDANSATPCGEIREAILGKFYTVMQYWLFLLGYIISDVRLHALTMDTHYICPHGNSPQHTSIVCVIVGACFGHGQLLL